MGCIIKGETYHFELIANEVARKIMDMSLSFKKPIGFGILTCDNIKQAEEMMLKLKKRFSSCKNLEFIICSGKNTGADIQLV